MKQLDIIEQEIAELEKSKSESDKQLKRLRKAKALALKQQEEDKKVKGLKEIDDLVNAANDELSDTSLSLEKDDALGSILVKLDDEYLETSISFEDLNFKKISGFVNTFVRNAKTVEKIYSAFDDSSDYMSIQQGFASYDDLSFAVHGRAYDIHIKAKSDSNLSIKLTKDIDLSSECAVIEKGGISYKIYMADSYDHFYIDASVSAKCEISKFDETFERLLNKLDEAEVDETDC